MDSNTRMFEDHFHLTVEEVTSYINELIKNDNSIIDENEAMNKWISLPAVLLDSDLNKDRFIETVVYIDDLMIKKEEKVSLINTLASMLVAAKIKISDIDVNSLYLLVSYFKSVPQSDYKKEYALFANQELLERIRFNTLDVDKRDRLMHYIMDQAKKSKVNFKDLDDIHGFQKQVIEVLKDKTIDEIIGTEEYLSGKVTEPIEFRDYVKK